MKAHELAALLRTCDPGIEVLVEGYEGGYSPIHAVAEVEVQELDRHGDVDYLGRYEPTAEAQRQASLHTSALELSVAQLSPPSLVGHPVNALILRRDPRDIAG